MDLKNRETRRTALLLLSKPTMQKISEDHFGRTFGATPLAARMQPREMFMMETNDREKRQPLP